MYLQITSYIEESNNIKKKFNIEEENEFIESLPKNFKKHYQNESNKSIFQQVYFFRNLAEKALQSLAESIEITITHPEEVIVSMENYLSLKILKQGSVGYCTSKPGCIYNGVAVDTVNIGETDSPFLIGLSFFLNSKPIYDVKSLEYSVTYTLTYDELIASLKKSQGDY